MEGFWQRNTSLDGLFYDVSSVTASATALLRSRQAAEGAALRAAPTGALAHNVAEAFGQPAAGLALPAHLPGSATLRKLPPRGS